MHTLSPVLTVSIVTYNSQEVIGGCLDSLLSTTAGITSEIIVVDNASDDRTVAVIKEHFPLVRLVENSENAGFGRGHNQAFALSRGEYFCILNPDTVIFPGTMERLVSFMEATPKAGAAGCKILWDDEGMFLFPDLRIHDLLTALLYSIPLCVWFPDSLPARYFYRSAHRLWLADGPALVQGITGGLMMVRRKAFEAAGGFDENFFLFFEEHDLLRNIRTKGWHIYYLPDVQIQHFFEDSCRKSTIDIGKIYRQSALYYYEKHYTGAGRAGIQVLHALNRALQRLPGRSYPVVSPREGTIALEWPPVSGATRYIVEISYAPGFCDRGAAVVKDNRFIMSASMLKRLPQETGFVRIIPVYADNSTGPVITTVKVTGKTG